MAVLSTRGQCHHLALLRETATDLAGGIRSVPEAEFAQLIRRAGLPEPQRQIICRRPDGRYYLDADWPHRQVSAEVEGSHHRRAAQLERDWDRHNEITISGRRVFHFTSYAVRHHPDRVVAVLARALVA
jgi:very-short-patch-repair endonuclease